MTDTPPARLKIRYHEEIRPALVERFGYTSVMQAPKLEKVTLNMGVGLAKQDSKMLKAATEQLAAIAGQQPSVRRARKSIAAFKLREGMPVGVAVTLRAERAYEFLDRLVSIAIPRIRDFRGLSARSFDGRGNYSMGVKEQIIFPEIDYDAIDMVRGLDITITTSAASDMEAYALLQAFGLPFSAERRPKGYDPEADAAAERAHEEAEAASAAAAAEAAANPPAPTKGKAKKKSEPVAEREAEEPQADRAAKPEAAEPAEPEAATETAEPEAATETAEPEAATETAEPEAESASDPAAEAQAETSEEKTADAPSAEATEAPEDSEAQSTDQEGSD
ncbi:MAG: 50S ribosomal protein L5 [Solirubrobacterales bacterium]|nr:50S ribosomal protein L5 [Solirubrobacterales bacterium]